MFAAQNSELIGATLMSLADACKVLPSRPSPATLWRWRTKGVKGIRLVGGRWTTTTAAIAEFLQAVTARALPAKPGDDPAEGRSDATAAKLRDAGLLKK